jgi:hypothetical protein
MLLRSIVAAAIALMASPAFADPDKDESGKGSYRAEKAQGGSQERYSYRIPRGHVPPPGTCRAWLDDRPAGQQPPPTGDCLQAQRLADRYGGRVIWGGGN